MLLLQPKAVKKHSLVGLGGKNSRKEEWLIAPRSTLQKSVSTPSIVAAQEIQEIGKLFSYLICWWHGLIQIIKVKFYTEQFFVFQTWCAFSTK